MRKIILGIIATIAISNLSFGQLTLENTYQTNDFDEEKSNVFNTDNGINYFTYDRPTNFLKMYNSNHILFKSLTIPLDAGYSLEHIKFPSDKLFNNDNLIEFIISFNNSTTPYIRKNILMNENGVVIQQFDDGASFYVVKSTANNYKLISSVLTITAGTPQIFSYQYKVYTLSGTLSVAYQNVMNDPFVGYPNPSENVINISNNLPNEEKGMLEVFDLNGKKVLQKSVIGENKEINLDVSDLSSGVYIYKLNGQTNKFIKK